LDYGGVCPVFLFLIIAVNRRAFAAMRKKAALSPSKMQITTAIQWQRRKVKIVPVECARHSYCSGMA
jgi:hypothetical protein